MIGRATQKASSAQAAQPNNTGIAATQNRALFLLAANIDLI
jgi:hypothetical protein